MRLKQFVVAAFLVLGALFLCVGSAHAQFAADTFAGTSGTSLSGQSLSTGGGTWTKDQNQAADWVYTGSNGAKESGAGVGNWCIYTASNTPPSTQYSVQATFVVSSTPYYVAQFQVVSHSTGAASSGYFGGYFGNSGSPIFTIDRGYNNQVAETSTLSSLPNDSYTILLTAVSDSVHSSYLDLNLYVHRASDGKYLTSSGTWGTTTAVSCVYYQDTSPYSTGSGGFWDYNDSSSPSVVVQNFSETAISIMVSPTTATTGTNETVTFTGSDVSNWSSAVPTITATAGSLGTLTATSSTTATATFTPPSTAQTVTFTDTTDGGSPTTTITVSYPVATAYTSSESATSGNVSVPVTLTYTGNGATTATITPSVSGVSGTFSPTTIALNNETGVTVTFTPSTSGTATFSSTNSGSLTNPSNLTYTVNNAPATSYTQSLSASTGPIGTAVTITYVENGTGTQTITPAVSGVSGAFSPTTVALNGTTPVTVTFTPSANGTATLTATNSGSLTNPASQTYAVNSATSYTSSESATSGSLGSPVTITYTGNGFSTATITPSVSGVSGTFSPTSIALNNTTSVTVTFTPSSIGTAMLSSTNSGSLTNPSNLTYTVAPGPITIPVSSSAWHFSPGNWAGSSGRTFGTYARTWCNGAYATVYWSTTSSSPTCTLNLTNATGGSDISYFIDNAFVDNVSVPSSGSITVTVSGAGSHVLTFFARNSEQASRWAENNSYTLTGVTVDNQSTVGTAPAWNGTWVLEVGDSITEGINADPSGNPDNLCDYSHLTGEALVANGYDYGVSACGYSGWIETGDGYGGGDVPRYYDVSSGVYQGNSVSRWCNIDSTTSLLDSNNRISAYGGTGQGPSVITINYGTNEELNGDSQSDMETSIEGCLAALRTAAPNAWILVYVPFNLYDTSIYGNGATYVADIKTAVADYQAAHTSDTKTILVDYGSAFAYHMANESGGGVHPNANGHALIGARTSATILSKLTSTTTGRGRILN